jgi:glycosyltransferase involved in cell wall biosynthesis
LELGQLRATQQLEPLACEIPNAWKATGSEPHFDLLATMPAGWLKLEVRVRQLDRRKGERCVAELQVDYGHGFEAGETLERFVWQEVMSDEVFIKLRRPALALRFVPMQEAGAFAIEEFRIESMSNYGAFRQAISRKIRLLRAYRCTSRVLFRGLGMLLTGQFFKFYRKVFKGLPDSRLMRPENDLGTEAYAAWWNKRGLSETEMARLQAEAKALPQQPALALLTVIDNRSEASLRLIVESIRRQVYSNWRLYIGVTGTTTPGPKHLLERYAATDDRIKIIIGPKQGWEQAAGRAAMERIEEPLVAVLNPGYELSEGALLRLIQEHLAKPDEILVNTPAPLAAANTHHRSESDAFRPVATGQQLNLFPLQALKSSGDFPEMKKKSPPPGVEFARRLLQDREPHYFATQLTYPSTNVAALQIAADCEEGLVPRIFVQPRRRPVLITGNVVGISGWDYVVYELVRGLQSIGIDVRLNALSQHRGDLLPPYLMGLRRHRQPGDQELVICPPHLLQHHYPEPGFLWFTMWESDRLEPKWLNQINGSRCVFLPSQWGIEGFRKSGVKVPLHRVPLGHDPMLYYGDGSWPAVCTFGTAGALWGGGIRKNIRGVIQQFEEAFPDEVDVRLRVKITPRCEFEEPDDPRIEILRGFMPPQDVAEWYRSLSAYVNGSYSEGFGLHLLEAMACGRPVISSRYSGVSEYFDETVGFPVEHRLEATGSNLYPGSWAIPNSAGMVAAMQAVYRNTLEAKRRAAAAAARAKSFTWKETGKQLVKCLEGYLML